MNKFDWLFFNYFLWLKKCRDFVENFFFVDNIVCKYLMYLILICFKCFSWMIWIIDLFLVFFNMIFVLCVVNSILFFIFVIIG